MCERTGDCSDSSRKNGLQSAPGTDPQPSHKQAHNPQSQGCAGLAFCPVLFAERVGRGSPMEPRRGAPTGPGCTARPRKIYSMRTAKLDTAACSASTAAAQRCQRARTWRDSSRNAPGASADVRTARASAATTVAKASTTSAPALRSPALPPKRMACRSSAATMSSGKRIGAPGPSGTPS